MTADTTSTWPLIQTVEIRGIVEVAGRFTRAQLESALVGLGVLWNSQGTAADS